MIRYHASWVVPIAARPVRDAWVTVDGGRVVALGSNGRPTPRADASEVDLAGWALMPGLVNAHTHLELSYMRDRVPRSSSFVAWVRDVMAARRQQPDPRAPGIMSAIERAIVEMTACGTIGVGDISNTLATFEPLTRSELSAVVFYELIRFKAPDPTAFVGSARREIDALCASERVRPSLAAHAPYSVAPLIFRAIMQELEDTSKPCSVHLSESREEVEFIQSGGGPWRTVLQELGVWDDAWVAPQVSPVQYLDENGFLHERALVVHGVHMTESDLTCLVERGSTLVACPRSNEYTGAGPPPLERFYNSGVRVAVGTDSLASVPDLNLFAELAAMRRLAPTVPASSLLESATRHGAASLGFEADYGTIEPGKRARLLGIAVPPRTSDVEEYLVSGIVPEQIRWIDDAG
jgi:cytosine/adenosine deaminase-related metal-dependent hydrolase